MGTVSLTTFTTEAGLRATRNEVKALSSEKARGFNSPSLAFQSPPFPHAFSGGSTGLTTGEYGLVPRLYDRRFQAEGSEFVGWQSIRIPVIPAEAGIQAIFGIEPQTNLDAGFHRHDELWIRLKGRD
jgi:hypothetical protein